MIVIHGVECTGNYTAALTIEYFEKGRSRFYVLPANSSLSNWPEVVQMLLDDCDDYNDGTEEYKQTNLVSIKGANIL
jgi:hypothetical protein